jgi:hypothetical protein
METFGMIKKKPEKKRSKMYQAGYQAGLDPSKSQKDNPYPIPDTPDVHIGWIASGESNKYWTAMDRYTDWKEGFTAARRYFGKQKKLAAKLAAEDAEYELYVNLGTEFGGM